MNSTDPSVTGAKWMVSWSTPRTSLLAEEEEEDSCWKKERCRYWTGILIAYTMCLVVFIICTMISRKYFKLYELEASRQHNPIEVRDVTKPKCSVLPPVKVAPETTPKAMIPKSIPTSSVVTLA